MGKKVLFCPAPLQVNNLESCPWEKIVIDVIGPIYPPSATAHRFNLTLLDLCTRYVEAIPLRYISADMSLKL